MDLDEIQKLLELLKDHDVSSFKYKGDDFSLNLNLGPVGVVQQVMAAAPVAAPAAPASAPVAAAAPAASAPAASTTAITIESPMVGTFYAAPNPDSPAYVKVGDKVSKGDVLCIVEAMKLFNEIESEHSGTIVEVCVDTGVAVQFGQALFKIEP